MMSIGRLKNLKITIKELGGGRKCSICSSSGGSVLYCCKCGKPTCVNHLHLTHKECITCSSSYKSSNAYTPPPPAEDDDGDLDAYGRIINAYYGGL